MAKPLKLTNAGKDALVLQNTPIGENTARCHSDIHLKIESKISFADLLSALKRLVNAGQIKTKPRGDGADLYYKESDGNFLSAPDTFKSTTEEGPTALSKAAKKTIDKQPPKKTVTEPIIKLQPQTSYTLTINNRTFGPFQLESKWHGFARYTSEKGEIITVDNTGMSFFEILGWETPDHKVQVISGSPDIMQALRDTYKGK